MLLNLQYVVASWQKLWIKPLEQCFFIHSHAYVCSLFRAEARRDRTQQEVPPQTPFSKALFPPHFSCIMHTFRITNALKHCLRESESIQVLYLLHWVFDISRERAVDTQVMVFPTHRCVLDKNPRLSHLIYAFSSISNVLCLESKLLVHISICNPFKNMLFTKRNWWKQQNTMVSRDAVISCTNNFSLSLAPALAEMFRSVVAKTHCEE